MSTYCPSLWERERQFCASWQSESWPGLRRDLLDATQPGLNRDDVYIWTFPDQDFNAEYYSVNPEEADPEKRTYGLLVSVPRSLSVVGSVVPEMNMLMEPHCKAISRYVDSQFRASKYIIRGCDVIDWVKEAPYHLRHKDFTKDGLVEYSAEQGTAELMPLNWIGDGLTIKDRPKFPVTEITLAFGNHSFDWNPGMCKEYKPDTEWRTRGGTAYRVVQSNWALDDWAGLHRYALK